MPKEIKNHLFNKKIGLIFLSFLVLVCLLLPLKRVEAIIGTGIFDFFETALGGIEEKAAPLAKQIIMVFITYVVSLIALYTSSNLLDLVIREQSNWLTVQNSPLVQAGWRFTSGLANLFLILIFVAIAIAYILKIETFQAKKALPKLIIIALLLNFSLVFVGVFVDIANIFYNTVLQGNEGLATQFIGILGAGGNDVLLNIMLWIGLLAGLFIIPFVGPFAQLAFVLLFVGVGFLPNIMTWIFQIVLFLMISGVFFTYVFLFATRVFLIQILAILAPLAFIALILPQTKKYWDEWLQHLLGWAFLGIFLLFFFAIGIRAANAIIPPGGLTPIPFLGWGQITAYFTYYFFLFIYFILVIYVSKKFMPTLAAFIIAQATQWSGVAWQRAIKPFGKVFQKSGERVWKEKGEAITRKTIEKVPMLGRVIGGPGTYEAALKRRTATEFKKIEDRSPEALHKIVKMRPISPEDRYRRAAAVQALMEKGRLEDAETTYIPEAQTLGVDFKEGLKKQPAFAHHVTKIDPETGQRVAMTIREVVEKMSPGELRANVEAESLETLEVFFSTNLRQIQELGRRGTRRQKEAIRNLIIREQARIQAEINRLRTTGRPEDAREADKIRDIGNYAYRHPDYVM